MGLSIVSKIESSLSLGRGGRSLGWKMITKVERYDVP